MSLKQEILETLRKTEQELNRLLRILYEQRAERDLIKKLKPDLAELKRLGEVLRARVVFLEDHQNLGPGLNKKIFEFRRELERALGFFERAGEEDLRDLQRVLGEQKRLLRGLREQLAKDWQEPLSVKILGIGEITTTIELLGEGAPWRKKPEGNGWIRFAIKKAPSFPSKERAEAYLMLCYEYEDFLSKKLGIKTPYAEHRMISGENSRWLVYNFQERLRSESIACVIIQVAEQEVIETIFLRLLKELRKIFLWNCAHPEYQIGFDGQIPNWAFPKFGPEQTWIKEDDPVLYLDTTTPMIRREGRELLDTEVFIKSIPIVLRPIVRRTLLKEVLDRYYQPRAVVLDLIASFITHHRADLVPRMVELANQWLKENLPELKISPYSVKEIISYNRQDVLLWKFFRQMKRMDRFITERIFQGRYEQRLPRGSPERWENLVGAGGKGLSIPEGLRFLVKGSGG